MEIFILEHLFCWGESLQVHSAHVADRGAGNHDTKLISNIVIHFGFSPRETRESKSNNKILIVSREDFLMG